jgi:hypothetical protein
MCCEYDAHVQGDGHRSNECLRCGTSWNDVMDSYGEHYEDNRGLGGLLDHAKELAMGSECERLEDAILAIDKLADAVLRLAEYCERKANDITAEGTDDD